jgi:hypothetical protein
MGHLCFGGSEEIWNDFAPYRAELQAGGEGSTAAELASAGRSLAGAGPAADAEPYLVRALAASPHSRDALAALVPIRYERARRLHRDGLMASARGDRRLARERSEEADSAYASLEPLAARLVEADPDNPAALDWLEEVLKRNRKEAEIPRMRALRAEMRATVDSLALLIGNGAPRVEGRVTPRDRNAAVEVVVTFLAADGAELGTASAPVRLAPRERSARFTVLVPAGLAAAGYRHRLRVTEPGRD